MTRCECQMAGASELRGRLNSDKPDEREQAVNYLVSLLTSRDESDRHHGYELYKEGIDEALFRSCLEYRGLIGGFTHPLLDVVARAVEFWARSSPEGRGDVAAPAATT